MTQLLIDRATLEQLVKALEFINYLDCDINFLTTNAQEEIVDSALTAGRAALANAEPKKAEDMANRRLGTNGGVPYNEQLEIARRWDRAVDAGSPITARSRHELP